MRLPAGDKLGPYEILAPIGAGGMGEVYRARDTRLDRIVAIKTSKTEFSERFAREARAVAALNHPNICQLDDPRDPARGSSPCSPRTKRTHDSGYSLAKRHHLYIIQCGDLSGPRRSLT